MVEVEISSFDVVDGSRRIYIHPMFGESGSGLSGANDDDSVLVAVDGPRTGMVGGRAVLAAQVVTFDVSGSGAVNRYGAEPRGVH